MTTRITAVGQTRESLSRLCEASLSKFFVPEKDVGWGVPFDDGTGPVLPEDVVSLCDTTLYGRLAARERARLARHELASMCSAFVRFEGLLNQTLSRLVRTGDPLDPTLPYVMHVIEEEARHSRMFARLVQETGCGSFPLAGGHGAVERAGESIIGSSKPLFFVAMLAVEEITDAVIARVLAYPGCHPMVHDVFRIHRVEESRHMQFGREAVREIFESAGLVERQMIAFAAPMIAFLIFEMLVPPGVYVRAGVASSSRKARRLWREARISPRRSDLRRESVGRLVGLFSEIGVINQRTRPLWATAGLLD